MAGSTATEMPPGAPADPMTSADAGAGNPNALGGFDFAPDCADETAHALMSESACSFPLPEGVEVSADLASIALVSNGQFTTVERVSGPFACDLLSGGFFFDSADPPTRITLCPQSCLRAGAAAEMQVVLVLGCAPPATP